MALLELNDVNYGVKGALPIDILENVNLSVQKGEFVSIVGYPGSGKTTLINLIAGLLRPG